MITVTKIAANKIREMLKKRGKGLGIQLGVRTTGCSGMAYTLEYVDTPPVTRDFHTFDCHDVTVWIAGRAMPYLDGLVIDWKKQGLNEGFEFINPQEASRCGCGQSFSV